MDVVSLFHYQNIDQLLLSKHRALGYRIYRYFGRRYLQPFLQAFAEGLEGPAYLIPVDDLPQGGYSHTAVMARHASVASIRPLYGALRARNRVRYAGQSLRFRLENPRRFRYTGPQGIDAILLDDIITTGSTLSEARQVLAAAGVNVLLALTIADAREN
jgi:competence protein ComFC